MKVNLNKNIKRGFRIQKYLKWIEDCFVIGYNHDIGYEFSKNGINHNKIGGEILKRNNFKYWKEIYHYGEYVRAMET